MRAGLIDDQVALYNKKLPMSYKQFWDVISTKDRYYQLAQYSDMPALEQVGELISIPEIALNTPGSQQIIPLGYKGKYVISNEAWKRDPENLYKKVPKFMANSFQKAMDLVGAGVLSRATDTSYLTTWDGLAIASASHLVQNSTFSNILTSNPVLTYAAVQNAILALQQQPNYLGEIWYMQGPYKLLVPVALKAVAMNIMISLNGGRYDVNTHEKNWAGEQISEVVVVTRSTSTTAWGLVCTSEENNPFAMVQGLAMDVNDWYDGNQDAWAWNVTGMFAPACRMPQGFVYSSGAGS